MTQPTPQQEAEAIFANVAPMIKRRQRLRIATVVEVTALWSGLSAELLRARVRDQHVVDARHVAMWLSRQLTGQSLSGIGRYFNRDHSTVANGIRRVEERRGADVAFGQQVECLRDAISEWAEQMEEVPSPAGLAA